MNEFEELKAAVAEEEVDIDAEACSDGAEEENKGAGEVGDDKNEASNIEGDDNKDGCE